MAEIEFEVPGPHPPCRETVWDDGAPRPCFSMERTILHVPTNMGKKLVCGRGHNQRRNKPFIAAYEFEPGEQFADIVLPEYLPNAQRTRESRWKIPSDAPIYEQEVDTCVACGAPPYDLFGGPDITQAWPWLESYAPELLARIHQQVAQHRGAALADWPSLIDEDLRRAIRERLDQSLLQVDHGVPKKVGNDLWVLLTPPERRLLQMSLLFKMCRRCNGTKSKKLLPQEEIERYYIGTYYDGDRAAAIADATRWAILDRTLTKIYENAAVG